LAGLEGVKSVRNGWMALCPAHQDHHPSLHITVGRKRALLVHCFAGCDFACILTAIKRNLATRRSTG
jgi:putative DNA primase/helicase